MIDQGLMELEPCYGIDDCRKFLDTDGAHEQRGQPEQKAIERGQLRSALPESIADQHMMLEQQGLCSDGACPTGSKERRTSNDQVNDEDEQLAHGPNVTTIEHADKTARNGPCALNSKFTNSPLTGVLTALACVKFRFVSSRPTVHSALWRLLYCTGGL